MNYLTSNHHTIIWFWFIAYAITIIFLVPNNNENKVVLEVSKVNNEEALKFASKIVLRIALLIPLLFALKKAI